MAIKPTEFEYKDSRWQDLSTNLKNKGYETYTLDLPFYNDPSSTLVKMYLNGEEIKVKNPQDANNKGIGIVSEDRKKYGLNFVWDIKTNLVISNLKIPMPELTESDVMELSLEVSLTDGRRLTAFGATWHLDNGKLTSAVG